MTGSVTESAAVVRAGQPPAVRLVSRARVREPARALGGGLPAAGDRVLQQLSLLAAPRGPPCGERCLGASVRLRRHRQLRGAGRGSWACVGVDREYPRRDGAAARRIRHRVHRARRRAHGRHAGGSGRSGRRRLVSRALGAVRQRPRLCSRAQGDGSHECQRLRRGPRLTRHRGRRLRDDRGDAARDRAYRSPARAPARGPHTDRPARRPSGAGPA